MLAAQGATFFETGFPLISAAAVGWYVAGYGAAWASGADDDAPASSRVLAAVVPIAAATLAAAVLKRSDLAIGLPIAAATVSVTLAAGMTLLSRKTPPKPVADEASASPPGESASSAPEIDKTEKSTAVWPLLLPTAVLLLLIGFGGRLTIGASAGLLLAGGAVTFAYGRRTATLQIIPLILTACIAGVAGWLAVRGMDATAAWMGRPVTGPLTATLLAPALLLPTLGQTTVLANQGRWQGGIGVLVSTSLACLLGVLPIAALGLRYFNGAWPTLPPLVWRVDGVVLLAASVAVLGMALGRLPPVRIVGFALLFLYAAYVLMWAWVAR